LAKKGEFAADEILRRPDVPSQGPEGRGERRRRGDFCKRFTRTSHFFGRRAP
jgi:hypothetical protein